MSHTGSIELHTARLQLRTLDTPFAPRVLSYLLRNRAFFAPWNPTFPTDYYSLHAQAARLAADAHLLNEDRGVRLWLFAQQDHACERVIGDVTLSNIVRGAFQSCHVGYKIDEACANNGFMTEALQALSTYAFHTLKLHRLEANIMPRNARSRRVVEKLGFVNEGISHKYLKINGVWEDHLHYVLLNPAEE